MLHVTGKATKALTFVGETIHAIFITLISTALLAAIDWPAVPMVNKPGIESATAKEVRDAS